MIHVGDALAVLRFGRQFIGIELNPEYAKMAERRIGNTMPLLKGLTA